MGINMTNIDKNLNFNTSIIKKLSVLDNQSQINLLDHQKNIVTFTDFSFRYGNSGPFVLKNINLKLAQGQVILLGGVSGSGKTTLCNAIAGKIPFSITGQYSGKISLFGKDIWEHNQDEFSRKVSYMFQNADEQLVTFTVFDEISFAAENLNIQKKEIIIRVNQVAKDLGISNLLKRPIFSLSGGEKQKVILAANLVMNPKILILDEPLAFLDSHSVIKFIQLIRKLRKIDSDLSIIIIEHRLQPFLNLVNKIIILDEQGTIAFEGNLQKYLFYQSESALFHLRDDAFIQNFKLSLLKNKNNPLKNTFQTINEELIRIEDINFTYENQNQKIFSNFSLKINRGEFIGIVGDNGTGKTTLLYLIANVLEPNSGKIFFQNQDYINFELEDFIPKIGFIFQNPENQIFESTIKDEILYAPRNFSQYKKNKNLISLDEEKIINNFAPLIGEKRYNLHEFQNINPFCLSWGQKRRLNLASIFSYNPDLILVDEPFIGQDAQSIKQIFEILHKFHLQGKTIIIISHDRELLNLNCSRIIELNKKYTFNNTKVHSGEKQRNYPNPTITHTIKKKTKSRKKLSRINLFLNKEKPIEDSNWLFKLNPISKLFFLISLTIFLFCQKSIIFLSLCYFFILLIAKQGGIPPKQLLLQVRLVLILTLIYIPLNTLFDANNLASDQILFYLFTDNLPVRRLALYYSLRTGFLIVIFMSTVMIFLNTTSPKDLVYALIEIGIPYRYAFSFMIGLRYIPLIEQESNTIEIAQTLRGSHIKKGNSFKKIFYHILHRISTLLISIIRKAKTTASTIESRGFGLNRKRTNVHHVGWSSYDGVTLFILLSIILLNILLLTNVFRFNLHFPSLFTIFQNLS